MRHHSRIAAVFIFLLCTAADSRDNPPQTTGLVNPQGDTPDTIANAKSTAPSPEKSSLLWPALEVVEVNLLIGGYNYFIAQAPYAGISGQSIKENFRTGFVWDDDNFNVNQIGHPYQGGLYYSAARMHGQGYFSSLPYAALGSLQWEFFMETEHPALNDLATTTLGGAMFGEITWRLADELLDPHARGLEFFFRELGVGLLNPTRGLHRLFNGYRYSNGSAAGGRRAPSASPLQFRFATGGRFLPGLLSDDQFPGRADAESRVPQGSTNLTLVYGDPFTARKPFDHFVLSAGLGLTKDPVLNVAARALIWSYSWYRSGQGEGTLQSLIGLAQNFDFINSGIYRVSASGAGIFITSHIPLGRGWHFQHSNQLQAIALGGASTEYYVSIERDYNLGSGAGMKSVFLLRHTNIALLSFTIDRYWIHTLSGAKGDEYLGLGTVELQKSIWRRFGASLAWSFYDREGRYDDYEDKTVFNHELHFLLTYGSISKF